MYNDQIAALLFEDCKSYKKLYLCMLGDGAFTSTLRVPGPPDVADVEIVRYYQCRVEPRGFQHSFPIFVLKGNVYIYHYKA